MGNCGQSILENWYKEFLHYDEDLNYAMVLHTHTPHFLKKTFFKGGTSLALNQRALPGIFIFISDRLIKSLFVCSH